MDTKFGIVLVNTNSTKTVMQFGFESWVKAAKVIDKARKSLDPTNEALYVFSYPAEMSEGLSIGEPLLDFATIDSPVQF